MVLRDFNGDGKWTKPEITRRYLGHARRLGIASPRIFESPGATKGDDSWIFPVMLDVITGIEDGDLACATVGVELIEEDRGMFTGALLKSNTARALRRFSGLPQNLVDRIRLRVIGMLATGIVPREYREYAKLLRAVGIGSQWKEVMAARPRNHNARRARSYLLNHCRPEGGGSGT